MYKNQFICHNVAWWNFFVESLNQMDSNEFADKVDEISGNWQ